MGAGYVFDDGMEGSANLAWPSPKLGPQSWLPLTSATVATLSVRRGSRYGSSWVSSWCRKSTQQPPPKKNNNNAKTAREGSRFPRNTINTKQKQKRKTRFLELLDKHKRKRDPRARGGHWAGSAARPDLQNFASNKNG